MRRQHQLNTSNYLQVSGRDGLVGTSRSLSASVTSFQSNLLRVQYNVSSNNRLRVPSMVGAVVVPSLPPPSFPTPCLHRM